MEQFIMYELTKYIQNATESQADCGAKKAKTVFFHWQISIS
jgi:hypothetical protein